MNIEDRVCDLSPSVATRKVAAIQQSCARSSSRVASLDLDLARALRGHVALAKSRADAACDEVQMAGEISTAECDLEAGLSTASPFPSADEDAGASQISN